MRFMKPCTTRERLLEVAMDLIWTESYGSVGVDEICRKTKIQKGSFYHFFPSKVDLAVAALNEAWEKHRPNLEQNFSPDKEPVQRLMDHLAFAIEKQKALKARFGFFPGCPYTAIGIEQGGQQEILRRTAEKHMECVRDYFEKAIRDAVRAGTIRVKNPSQKASEIYSLYIGAFTRLRITDDIRVLSSVKEGVRSLLGLEGTDGVGGAKGRGKNRNFSKQKIKTGSVLRKPGRLVTA